MIFIDMAKNSCFRVLQYIKSTYSYYNTSQSVFENSRSFQGKVGLGGEGGGVRLWVMGQRVK